MLLKPKELISYLGLDIAESTLSTSRTSGMLGDLVAPRSVYICQKPYYLKSDADEWLANLKGYPASADHKSNASLKA
jgi:hypothetical protein